MNLSSCFLLYSFSSKNKYKDACTLQYFIKNNIFSSHYKIHYLALIQLLNPHSLSSIVEIYSNIISNDGILFTPLEYSKQMLHTLQSITASLPNSIQSHNLDTCNPHDMLEYILSSSHSLDLVGCVNKLLILEFDDLRIALALILYFAPSTENSADVLSSRLNSWTNYLKKLNQVNFPVQNIPTNIIQFSQSNALSNLLDNSRILWFFAFPQILQNIPILLQLKLGYSIKTVKISHSDELKIILSSENVYLSNDSRKYYVSLYSNLIKLADKSNSSILGKRRLSSESDTTSATDEKLLIHDSKEKIHYINDWDTQKISKSHWFLRDVIGLKTDENAPGALIWEEKYHMFSYSIPVLKDLLLDHVIIGVDLGKSSLLSIVCMTGLIKDDLMFECKYLTKSFTVNSAKKELCRYYLPFVVGNGKKVWERTTFHFTKLEEIYFTKISDEMNKMAEDLGNSKKGKPLVIVGDPSSFDTEGFAGMILLWLTRHFRVIILNEFNTSKKCPQCLRNVVLEDDRVFRCPPCNLELDRDLSASFNMIWKVLYTVGIERKLNLDMEEIKKRYISAQQEHVFKFYDTLDSNDQKYLLNTLSSIDIERCNRIFKTSTEATKETKDVLSPLPTTVFESTLTADASTIKQWEEIGLKLIAENKVAVILLAGGQGTRLGSSDPKGCYDIQLPSRKSLFQLQGERILRLQQIAQKYSQNKDMPVIPWYVMTSGPTHEPTESFFKKNEYFGLSSNQVFFFQQGVLPAFTPTGKLFMETKKSPALAPDGNGGIYAALRLKGVLSDLEKRGIPYVHAYCVDNCLVKVADPIFIGYCVSKNADCGAKVVPKKSPDEAVGVICLRNSKFSVVEYSEIDKEISQARNNNGGLLYNAANIANHFYTTDFLKNIENFEHQMEYHIAKKKIKHVDLETGENINPEKANGIKLELFIFDVFPFTERMAVLECERCEEFSPLKNAPGCKDGDSPDTSRADIMAQHVRFIEKAGGTVSKGPENTEYLPLFEISPMVTYAGEDLEKVKNKTIVTPKIISSKDDL